MNDADPPRPPSQQQTDPIPAVYPPNAEMSKPSSFSGVHDAARIKQCART
jgi:hypothetical protein